MNFLEREKRRRKCLFKKIDKPAIRFNGIVYTGLNHGDIVDRIEQMSPELNWSEIEKGYGFTTTLGRFLNRLEAHELAQKNEQIQVNDKHSLKEYLVSENLKKENTEGEKETPEK